MTIRRAVPADASALARLAAATFPLVCPPGTGEQAQAGFIRLHLSEERFVEYLADPERIVFVEEEHGRLWGYTMLVHGEPGDPEAAAAVTIRPCVELSKCYVLPERHGRGTARALMAVSLDAAVAGNAAGIWLGVNEANSRAIHFYESHGFAAVGRKSFLLGDRYQKALVLERALP